jgi:hypothetical protein
LFVVAFLLDFLIRLMINPRYSPTMILGRFITRDQEPEYTGAPQKRFAWSIGLVLAMTMFVLVVVLQLTSWINLLLCLFCLTFLLFESAFGICLGCIMYARITGEDPKLCPGGSCEIRRQEPIQEISAQDVAVVVGWLIVLSAAGYVLWVVWPMGI